MKKPDISKLVSSNEEWPGEKQEMDSFQESKIPHLQVQLDPDFEEKELAKKEAYLQSWERLQTEFEDLQQLFQDFAALVESQGDLVTQVETHVATTQENVEEGTRQLAYASKLKVASYPLFGALLGGCVGGPIGLVAGLKLGGLAAIGGGILGKFHNGQNLFVIYRH
ncbi:hypothetical protein B566_EDAN004109 [Ephemera danica]|nr:hypothetical protein B566_EDAN004109 [Ephemera danica]